MNKIVNYIAAATLMVGAAGCNDLLDQMPHNSISGGNMWTTEAQADLGVIGVYSSIQNPVQGDQLIGQNLSIGNYAFEAFGMTGQGSYGIQNLFTSGVNPSNPRFSFMWKWCFDGIHRANEAIAYIPEIAMEDAKKRRLVAECLVLRAFFYSRLNQLYGGGGLGVPLYLEPTAPDEFIKGQSEENVVWAQIIRDLSDAIDEPNLKDNDIQGEGRTSRGLAYALRGKAYLITKDFDRAAADFARVAECGYGLHPDYQALFKEGQERCEEMIFSIQYIEAIGYGSRIQKFCGPFQAGSKDSRGCWTDVQIAPAVVELYEVIEDGNTVKSFVWEDFLPEWGELSVDDRKVFFIRDRNFEGSEIHPTITTAVNTQIATLTDRAKDLYMENGNEARISRAYTGRDPRMGYNVIVPYAHFRGVNSNSSAEVEYIYRWPVPGKYYGDQSNADSNLREGMLPSLSPNAQARLLYMFRKFIGEGLEYDFREANPVDEPIIRYADVLLMWAEALVEKGDLAGAMDKVKQVRDRVGIPTMAVSFADQTTARNYVRDERRREFVGEGVNFFDEMRWHTLKQSKFDTRFPQMAWGGQTGGTTYQWIGEQWYVWPVPKAEVEMNRNLKPTPGWEY
jgi:SusD family.